MKCKGMQVAFQSDKNVQGFDKSMQLLGCQNNFGEESWSMQPSSVDGEQQENGSRGRQELLPLQLQGGLGVVQ